MIPYQYGISHSPHSHGLAKTARSYLAVVSQPKDCDSSDIARLSRQELIARLLKSNEISSFQFSPAWLNKQWTRKLRALLMASRSQRLALTPTLNEAGAETPD